MSILTAGQIGRLDRIESVISNDELCLLRDGVLYRIPSAAIPSQLSGVTEVSSTYTALLTDSVIQGDTTSGVFTITLFTAVGNEGKVITLKKLAGASPNLTIDGNGSETIDGSATVTLTGTDGPSITIVSDNSNWIII